MGAWATLKLSAERTYRAHPTFPGVTRFGSGAALEYEFLPETDETVPEAKSRAEACLSARLGRYALRFGSPEALLDQVATDKRLATGVQTLLAYAHIATAQFSGRNGSRDLYAVDSEAFEKRLVEACAAVASTATVVLGLNATAPGVNVGGSLASTMGLNDR